MSDNDDGCGEDHLTVILIDNGINGVRRDQRCWRQMMAIILMKKLICLIKQKIFSFFYFVYGYYISDKHLVFLCSILLTNSHRNILNINSYLKITYFHHWKSSWRITSLTFIFNEFELQIFFFNVFHIVVLFINVTIFLLPVLWT